MHCLGAVSGGDSASPSGVSSRGGVMSVVRALGVLVCEGRIQGPPRGYKEGPHCAAPLQAPPNDHMCEKDNYLCGRYLVLVREIADRIAIGSSLYVEVLMCSDCPCGLTRATCKDPVSLMSSTAISQWQHPSDILLEYWSIGVVPSKSPEMMNSQGLYQAVRSRLHFSQVAAWWSRSNGTKPNYVTTRVVPYNEDNLRKFRESPIEHTFPLAGIGDGNSIKVTVWALPRMEEVPTLNCPAHPIKDNEEECVARALTPTKNGPVASSPHAAEALVLPVLVDDRLQTPCDKPGKHHCDCEDEEGCPPSPSIRPNGERKRRRSLPCGPPETGPSTPFSILTLPSVQETVTPNSRDSSQSPNFSRYSESPMYASRNHRTEQDESHRSDSSTGYENRSYLSSGSLERSFRAQVSLEEQEGNDEKRYKPTTELSENNDNTETNKTENSSSSPVTAEDSNNWSSIRNLEEIYPEKLENPQSFVSLAMARSLAEANDKTSRRYPNDLFYKLRPVSRETNLVINPFADRSCFHEPNPGPSSYSLDTRKSLSPTSPPCTVHHNYSRASRASAAVGKPPKIERVARDDVVKNCFAAGKDLTNLMSKLSFPKEKSNQAVKNREEGGIFDWFSKVPGRVLAVPSSIVSDEKSKTIDEKPLQESKNSEVKLKNCNLELSQREFDEVLAVLRARTPSGRKRNPVKTIRRRDRSERLLDDSSRISDNSDTCVCPIHREVRRNITERCVCKFCKKIDKSIGNHEQVNNDQCIYHCQSGLSKREDFTEELHNSTKQTIVKSTERLQNVSNKADVLLGAILRTRERKGLSDISNGTKPRTVVSIKKSENLADEDTSSIPRIISFEDERSLPSALNKRLNRFKQLFKKEWEKREILTTEGRSKEFISNYSTEELQGMKNGARKEREEQNVSQKKLRESRIKRRIDFTNVYADIGKSEENYEQIVNGAISETHQNSPQFNSTNCYKSKDSNYRKNYDSDVSVSSAEFESRDSSPVDEGNARETFGKSGTTPIALQNGCPSVRLRKSNEPISIDIEEDEAVEKGVPSAIEQEQFRRSLENAASMVFHSRTGLPLTSSPAPLRRGSCCFDYDSSLNSVSSKRSALFELNTPPSPGAVSLEETDREIENSCEGEETPKRTSTVRSRPQSHALLGSFEESALNGRLEPVSTVHGFTAELGASGSFCPKHRKLPVTVFFYTLGDNDKVSTPYLAHINLGKKGYQVPRSGTIQVTLLNPLGTVVKMFVVLYDLSDMPPRSHTFLRQRTLRDKTLRYLVHLRFMSGKSGRIYLHTDIRMIICRKSDVDTASDFGSEPPKELRSYIHGPTNPKFSPRC